MIDSLIVLSLVVSTFTFTTIILFGKYGPLVAFTTFSSLSVLWGWFAPSENELIVIRFLLFFVSLVSIFLSREKLYVNIKKNLRTKLYEVLLVNGLIISSAVLVRSFQPKFLYELLFNGYDNYGHLAVFFRTFEMNGFEYSPRVHVETPNILISSGYPLLVHMVWSAILRLFNFRVEGSESLIQFFAYFSILTLLYLSYLLILIVLTQFKKCPKYAFYAIALLAIVLIFLTQYSVLVLQGFPPTLAGLIYTLTVYVLIKIEIRPILKWILLCINVILTGYSYQLFVPIAYIGFIAFSYSQFRNSSKGQFYLRFLTTHIVLLLAAAPLILVSQSIPSYLFAFGGIQMPHLSLIAVILICNLGLLFFGKWDSVSLGYFLSTALGATLIAWAKLNGVGYYYAIKILYVSLILGIVALILNLGAFKSIKSVHIKLTSMALVTFTSLILANQPSVFQNSSTIQVLTSKGIMNPCVGSLYEAVISEGAFGMNDVIFVYTNAGTISDLRTRQMNAINGRWDNEIFNFSIPYGQSDNQNKFLDNYYSTHQNTRYLKYDYPRKGCD